MKLEIIFVVIVVAFVNTSKHENDIEVMAKTEDDVTRTKSSEEMQTCTNHTQSGVASLNTKDVRNNTDSDDKIKLKRPLKLKIIPRVMKTVNKNYWKSATTRKPLMKHTKYTVKPLTMLKLPVNVTRFTRNETERISGTILFNKIMEAPTNDDSSEEISYSSSSGEDLSKNQSVNVEKTLPSFKQVLSRVNNKTKKPEKVLKSKEPHIEPHKNITEVKNNVSASEFSSEEREDREEFIFVKPEKIKKDSEESEETATIFEAETKIKQRRSINVIEEENLGTTVSGFKFTGKIESFISDLTFKNINN